MKKNKYSTPLWMLATILAGMLSPMQSAVNGQLGHWLQDGNACAVISFASGLVVMFFIIMARKETRQQFDAPRDKCTLSCAINGIHAAFHYLKKNYISGCVMTVPTG